MKTDELLLRVRDSRALWNEALAGVPAERMETPGLHGKWSVKDVVAHISWFEREMIGVIDAGALVGSDLWMLSPTERNAAIYREYRDRPLDEIQAEAARTFPRLLAALETLTDEKLADASHFADMPSEWIPWQIIAQNTFEHYDAHRAALETLPE